MKHFFVIMLCLIGVCHAGMTKKEPVNDLVLLESTKKAYNSQGDVELQTIVDIKVDETVAFKLNDKIVVGTVKKRIVDDQNVLKIFGVFNDQEKSGFIFEFKSPKKDEVNVKGILFFVNTNKLYSLQYNENKKSLFFKEDSIVVRELDGEPKSKE